MTVDEALAEAHRALFGRLVGWLFRQSGDLQRAEDAVAHAFASAVVAWRRDGVPASSEAWLRVASRNRLRTDLAKAARSVSVAPEDLVDVEAPGHSDDRRDDRLGLLLVCAHPAIDERLHAPLMLQAVLGVDAARIASVYLVPAATMGQRLSRAKTKIRDAGIRFRMPDPDELPTRLAPILRAVYAAYGIGDPIGDIAEPRDAELRGEAIRLAELLPDLLPDEPETWGLLALLLHTESRRPARVVDGRFVSLEEQDFRRWDAALRARADECLRRAHALGCVGRFQLEAAISAAHSARADGRPVDREAIVALYRGLQRLAPSIGAAVGYAGTLVSVGRPDDAALVLEELPTDAVRRYQPYWICRVELAAARGDAGAFGDAMRVAIGLTTDPVLRSYLLRKIGAADLRA